MNNAAESKNIIITLVNENDEIIGYEEKLETHRKGLLHRAFSILIYDKEGRMLIHQRALGKYHSPGLWTNACCGHPNKNEKIEDAINRRLKEEMGFECALDFSFKFHYQASFSNDLIENEIDHVYVGIFDGKVDPSPVEVCAYKWLSISEIKKDISLQPEMYTVWFRNIMKHGKRNG